MGDVDHWNVLLMLAPGEDVEKVKEFLQLPKETIDVFNLSYVFGSQYKEKAYEVRGQGTVLTKVKAVSSIIIILRHPASSIARMNLLG
jgi:hypothetical protein